MTLNRRQRIWLTVIIVLNVALWLIPSDVVKQIARDRHTMLGRYSRQHFTWIVGVMLFSAISFYVDWSRGRTYKRRWFQVLATLLFLLPTLAVVDFFLRSPERSHYIQDGLAYHHPPASVFERSYEDRPEAYRTYPDAPPGYGRVSCTMRTDKRGFRNRTEAEQYDVVVLGDSFAEGSRVSDEQAWPAQLADMSGLSVYNLGMSGYDPIHYLASLEEYGLALRPRYVLCMLYEGNDFRSAKSDRKRTSPRLSKRLKRYVKQSPIINAVDRALITAFGPINSKGPVQGIDLLDWMPLAVPDGPSARHYAFAPKQVRDLYINPQQFERDRHWLNTRRLLADMNELCKKGGCTFVVVYAPTKAHVMLPAVGGRLPAEKVRAFTALDCKEELPEPATFLTDLLDRIDAEESVVRTWCERESIPFASITEALREAATEGRQVYYTYDQHWTPEGQQVAADRVHRFLGEPGNTGEAGAGTR